MRKVDYQSSVDQYGVVGTLVKHFCIENTSGFDDLRVLVHGESDDHQEEDGNHNSGVLTHRWLRKVTCYSFNPVGSKSVLDYLGVMLSERVVRKRIVC